MSRPMAVLGLVAMVVGAASAGIGVSRVFANSEDCWGSFYYPAVGVPTFNCSTELCGGTIACAKIQTTTMQGTPVYECKCGDAVSSTYGDLTSCRAACVTAAPPPAFTGVFGCIDNGCLPKVCSEVVISYTDSNNNGQFDPIETHQTRCVCPP